MLCLWVLSMYACMYVCVYACVRVCVCVCVCIGCIYAANLILMFQIGLVIVYEDVKVWETCTITQTHTHARALNTCIFKSTARHTGHVFDPNTWSLPVCVCVCVCVSHRSQ